MLRLIWISCIEWQYLFGLYFTGISLQCSHMFCMFLFILWAIVHVCGWDIYQYRRSVLCLKLLSLHCSWIEHRLDQSYKYSLRHAHTINTPWRWAWAQSSLPNLIKQEINHYSTHTCTLTHFTTYTYTDSCTWTHSHKCKEITGVSLCCGFWTFSAWNNLKTGSWTWHKGINLIKSEINQCSFRKLVTQTYTLL